MFGLTQLQFVLDEAGIFAYGCSRAFFSICCIPMATVRGEKEEVLMHSSLM